MTITDCLFRDNAAAMHGGAVYTGPSGTIRAKDSSFILNVALDAGGAWSLAGPSRSSMEKCTVVDNKRAGWGKTFTNLDNSQWSLVNSNSPAPTTATPALILRVPTSGGSGPVCNHINELAS